MIRPLAEQDFDSAIGIVNRAWKDVYNGYVNRELLNNAGCRERGKHLKTDFINHRLSEYVWDESGSILGMLSTGITADSDKAGAFEIWRIYIAAEARGRGIGGQLLSFAEENAKENGYTEILIWAFSKNIRAIKFYLKYGYRIDKEIYLGTPYLTYGTRFTKLLKAELATDCNY